MAKAGITEFDIRKIPEPSKREISEITSFVKSKLIRQEKLIDIVDDIQFSIGFVPSFSPLSDISPTHRGFLALTTHRLIAFIGDTQDYRAFHITSLNCFTERHTSRSNQNWPFQFILVIPGGIELMVQSLNNDPRLTSIIAHASVMLGAHIKSDDGAMFAIRTYRSKGHTGHGYEVE
jgi:hypothetical protein